MNENAEFGIGKPRCLLRKADGREKKAENQWKFHPQSNKNDSNLQNLNKCLIFFKFFKQMFKKSV